MAMDSQHEIIDLVDRIAKGMEFYSMTTRYVAALFTGYAVCAIVRVFG